MLSIRYRPSTGDPMGVLSEDPFGGRPSSMEGAVLLYTWEGLLENPKGGGFPKEDRSTLYDLGYSRVMRTLADAMVTALKGKGKVQIWEEHPIGPFKWQPVGGRLPRQVEVDGIQRWVEMWRTGWCLSTWQGAAESDHGAYWAAYCIEPWPSKSQVRHTDFQVKALQSPYDFGMWHGWRAARAAWALAACTAELCGGQVEVDGAGV